MLAIRSFLRYLLIIVLAIAAFNLLAVPFLEPALIFFPVKKMGPGPASVGLRYEDVYFKAADGAKLNGWYLDNSSTDKVILLFHGNGGNISHRLEILQVLYGLPADVFIIDYHGYGRSEGWPTEKNFYLAADAAYDFLLEEKGYKPKQVVIMGSSLGGAAAIWLAIEEEASALIVQKSFTSAQDMALEMNPAYRKPFVWLRSSFDNLGRIGQVAEPKLIIHSREDEIIAYEMGVRLFEAAGQPKQLLLLDKGGHNDVYSSPEYMKALRRIVYSGN